MDNFLLAYSGTGDLSNCKIVYQTIGHTVMFVWTATPEGPFYTVTWTLAISIHGVSLGIRAQPKLTQQRNNLA